MDQPQDFQFSFHRSTDGRLESFGVHVVIRSKMGVQLHLLQSKFRQPCLSVNASAAI